jgi:hypothetical protein
MSEHTKFKYASITSVDAARSFSSYKLVLGEKVYKSESENTEKIPVIYCDTNYRGNL